MKVELDDWDREYYTGAGGEPSLFYVVFGDCDLAAPMSRGKYRSEGAHEGIDVMAYGPEGHPEVPGSFREGYLWETFLSDAPGLAETVAKCERCIVLRGSIADSETLNYLRDAIGLITHLLDQGGCVVYDPLMLRWWNPDDWKSQVFEPAAANPLRHTVILVSEEDDSSLKWFHTRGMGKFGRPDISVHDVPTDREDAVIELCERMILYQAYGGVVPDGKTVKMSTLPDGGVMRHRGNLDDPDFNNVHLDVSWPMMK